MNTTNKARTIVMVAFLAAFALVPSVEADTMAHSWLDVAVGFDFGQGAGLYDPDPSSPSYCAAYTEFYVGVSPVLLYYMKFRFWFPELLGLTSGPVGLYVPDPTNCATLVPGSGLALDYANFDAGGAFYSWNLLGATQVAALGDPGTWVTVEACSNPATTAGVPADNGVNVPPVGAFLAESLQCNDTNQYVHQLFPGCKALPASTVVGEFNLDNPVFVGTSHCNSVVGAPWLTAGDYAVQHCVSVTPFDTVVGLLPTEVDQDHFVVFNGGNPVTGGSLAAFALSPGTPPGAMFPNVSNFADDSGATSGNGCTGASALAALASSSPPPGGNPCNGLVDALCSYCTDGPTNLFPHDYRRCLNNDPNYLWVNCTLWLVNQCVIG